MARSRTQPAFLAKRGYRLRRVMDGARFLPWAGAVLVTVPILWSPAASPEPDTGRGWVYLFTVWAVLIVLAFAISRPLKAAIDREIEPVPDSGPEPDDG